VICKFVTLNAGLAEKIGSIFGLASIIITVQSATTVAQVLSLFAIIISLIYKSNQLCPVDQVPISYISHLFILLGNTHVE